MGSFKENDRGKEIARRNVANCNTSVTTESSKPISAHGMKLNEYAVIHGDNKREFAKAVSK